MFDFINMGTKCPLCGGNLRFESKVELHFKVDENGLYIADDEDTILKRLEQNVRDNQYECYCEKCEKDFDLVPDTGKISMSTTPSGGLGI